VVEAPLQPPVNEVALSVAIRRQDGLIGPLLPQILGEWFTDHPQVQQAPPYEIPTEPPGGKLRPAKGARLELVTENPKPRYWFISPDGQEVVQVQDNYLALNWRRRSATQKYVSYDNLRARFTDLTRAVEQNLDKRGGDVHVLRVELAYINVIEPNSLWRDTNETHRVISTRPPQADYEQFAFSYSRVLTTEGRTVGRLHVDLAPGWDWEKDEPRLGLNLTARSAELSKNSIDEATQFLDHAHDEIGSTFLSLLTPEARNIWGLQ
jgi:uncharacterized protein (TIGR04255 family)